MMASFFGKWSLAIELVGIAILSVAVAYSYVLARKGERGGLEYNPGLTLVILGLTMNVARGLSVFPSWFSEYSRWLALSIMATGVVFIERKWRRQKKAVKHG